MRSGRPALASVANQFGNEVSEVGTESYKHGPEIVAAAGAYRMIAVALLKELTDGTPRTVNIFDIKDSLIAEMKNTSTQGMSYEDELATVNAGIRAIEEFFSSIEINGPSDD